MFKVGDRLICIESEGTSLLIKNKLYIVVRYCHSTSSDMVYVETGYNIIGYFTERFVSLSEYRKQKLNKIEQCTK